MTEALTSIAILLAVPTLCWFATDPRLWRKLRPFGFVLAGIAGYLAILGGWVIVPTMVGAAFVHSLLAGIAMLIIVLFFCSGRRA